MDCGNRQLFGQDDGFALVGGLIVTLVLSVVAIGVMGTSSVEMQIAGNEREYTVNLYQAEAAAVFSAQTLENNSDDRTYRLKEGQSWFNDAQDLEEAEDLAHDGNWNCSGVDADDTDTGDDTCTSPDIAGDGSLGNEVAALTFFKGKYKGDSMKMGNNQKGVYTFDVAGRSQKDRSKVVVEIGYKTIM